MSGVPTEIDVIRAVQQQLRDAIWAGLSETVASDVCFEQIHQLIESSTEPLLTDETAVVTPPSPSVVESSQPVPKKGSRSSSQEPSEVAAEVAVVKAKSEHAATMKTASRTFPKRLSLTKTNEALTALSQTVAACQRCRELSSTRTQTVFGVGNPQARVMFIGEAPGADEDAQGEPFVGRAGQLLNKIIAACGWQREDLYICNILRCRPPGNRNPLPTEAASCREYLDAQIDLVQPEYIVCWGTIAAQNLLGDTQPISRLRKTFFDYKAARVLCTYHPSYLLRNPSAKKDVWEDLQLLLVEMGIDLTTLPNAAK